MKDPEEAGEGRRSSRLSLALPIVIHGKDAYQKAFRESTHTLIINRHGAKFLTSQQLVVGADILVENPTLGSVAKAKVVWVSGKSKPDGSQEAGVQLVESQNIWGLEFPPDNWAPKGKDPGAPAKEAPAPRPTLTESTSAQMAPSTRTSEEIATQVLQELHETANAHARQFRARLDQVVQQVARELELDLRARASAAKESELAAIEQLILASDEHLSVMKAEMGELDARNAASQENLGATLESIPLPLTTEQIQEKIEAEALPVLHLIIESGIGAARERFQAQTQADAGQALTAWRSHLHTERDSVLEETRQQIMMTVSSARETLNRDRDVALKEMKRQIQEEIQANKERVVSQIKAKLDVSAESQSASLVDRLNETLRETGERQANLIQTQLDALLVGRLAEAQRHLQLVGENLQNRVEEGLRAAGEKHSGELQARVQDIADKTAALLSDQVRSQVEASVNAAAEKSLQGWETRLQDIAHQTVASSSDQIRAQVEASVNAAAEKSLPDWQTRLQDIVSTTLASSSDPIRVQVEASANAAAEKSLQDWQARLQDIVSATLASSSDQIRAQVEASANAAAEKSLQDWQTRLQDIVSMTLASSSDPIRVQVEASANAAAEKSLQTWQAKLQEAADQAAASSSDQVQGQIKEALSALEPKLREIQERAVNDALEAFRGRLSQFLSLLQPGGNK